jgi:probable HAF family extracellular repeat protein
MTRSLNGLRCLALLGVLLAGLAHADVVDDVWRGTNIRLNAARIHVRGNDYATGYWLLPKAANTFDFNVPARQFGINSDLVLHLHGSRSGNVISWTFDDPLPRPYYLGRANNVTRVRGTLRARARQVRGADDPYCNHTSCPHNVELVLEPGTRVWVEGYLDLGIHFGWTEEVYFRQFIAYAGVPRPRLASVRVTLPTSRCSSLAPTELSGEVTLSSPAPTGGILVDLMSVDASVGVLPVRVPEAHSSARFSVRVPGGWSGPTVIHAASGGVRQSVRVALRQCVTSFFYFTQWHLLTAHLLPRLVLNGGSVVASAEGFATDALVTPQSEVYWLHDVLDAKWVQVKGVQATGDVFGTAYTEKGPSAFRLRAEQVKLGAELRLDGWEAVAANSHGTLLVKAPQDETILYRVDEVGPAKHPGLAGLSSNRVIFNSRGQVAATIKTDQGTRAVYVHGKDVKGLLDVESEATALNDVGVLLGVAHVQDKVLRPFRWSEEAGLEWLPLPEGQGSARATAINDGGWVVGTATSVDGTKQTAFITTPDGKSTMPLDKLIPPELANAGFRIQEALSLSDDFRVLVRAVNGQGQSVHLVLSP